MRWTWEVVLQISTFLGGLAAVVFFYDRYKSREKSKKLLPGIRPETPSTSYALFQDFQAGGKTNRASIRKTKRKTIFTDWEMRWTAIHYLLSSICFLLLGFWFGLGGQILFAFFGGIPSFLISHLLGKTKAKHEDAEGVFLYGASFSMGAGFLAMLLSCLLCYLNGDPNGDHVAGSGVAIISGIFCVLEAFVCTYLMVRWA